MICQKCERDIKSSDVSLGFCAGKTPIYFCRECVPPATADEVLKSLNNFVGGIGPLAKSKEDGE